MHPDVEAGIQSISFFPANIPPEDEPMIKISRGEERVFVWCIYQAMMEVEGLAEKQNHHIFIDNPISSIDDHNIFLTVSTLYDLIERHFEVRNIIITTHYVGLFSILCDWLRKGEKGKKYKPNTNANILSVKHGEFSLKTHQDDIFLYHLRILQLLQHTRNDKNVRAYHFAILRQVLQSVSSFLEVAQISHTINKIGLKDAEKTTRIVNTLAHRKVCHHESDLLAPDTLALFKEILDKLNSRYGFVTHPN